MEKWTKEDVAEVIEGLPLEREIEVLYILQTNSVVVEVGIKGNTSFSDIKKIGEAFGDDDVWIDALGNEEFKLTIFIL
ncbi:hypothetical protein [Prevotella falsenii]|uniref:hypothetical protein n=1 Tax=Prevotella falsenii TaxID=515414 RepID=UPI0012EBD9B6|nr:hypothetical protein [Prevotella falsenii]